MGIASWKFVLFVGSAPLFSYSISEWSDFDADVK